MLRVLCLLALFIQTDASWNSHRYYRKIQKLKSLNKKKLDIGTTTTKSLTFNKLEIETTTTKPGKLNVYPEILVVVDQSLHTKLGSSETQTKDYVTLFMSAVNLRFKNLKLMNVELNVAGIDIMLNSKNVADYITNNIVSKDSLDAQSALGDLGSHYYRHKPKDIVYDMVLVLTGLNMCIHKGKTCRKSTAGYAYVGGACRTNPTLKKINAVGLIEDDGGFSGAVVAAHEIGHLLGVSHDGTSLPSYLKGPSARGCPWNQGYIMSDLRRTERGLRWSKCSENQMFSYLSSGAASCLLNRPSSNKIPLKTFSELSAKVPSADDQCEKKDGTKSCFYNERICTQLFCVDARTGSCISYRPAVDGTKCNQNGICFQGECITAKSSV